MSNSGPPSSRESDFNSSLGVGSWARGFGAAVFTAETSARSKGRGASHSQAVEINPSYVQYQNADESLRFDIMKVRVHARFPGLGFDISFWFALFSPLVGLMAGFIFAWFFSSLAQ
jgi:hypothetical protein